MLFKITFKMVLTKKNDGYYMLDNFYLYQLVLRIQRAKERASIVVMIHYTEEYSHQ
jgi:hypothetical protein